MARKEPLLNSEQVLVTFLAHGEHALFSKMAWVLRCSFTARPAEMQPNFGPEVQIVRRMAKVCPPP